MVTGTSRRANLDATGLPGAEQRVATLERVTGTQFADKMLALQALVHRSAILERQRDGGAAPDVDSNERLEFLGDAVLSMLVASIAFETFAEESEGKLTEIRAALVRRSTLAILAEELGLGDLMYMGRSERALGGRGRRTVLAEALEAVLAAVYLDQGLAEASRFARQLYRGRVDELLARASTLNAKSRLQEVAQSALRVVPVYALLARSGPAHDSRFEVVARAGSYSSVGQGTSIRHAEQAAAASLIALLEHSAGVQTASAGSSASAAEETSELRT